jgi:hypothetical protein
VAHHPGLRPRRAAPGRAAPRAVHPACRAPRGAQAQLEGFRIGIVAGPPPDEERRVAYRTWDELVALGRIPQGAMPTYEGEGRKWVSPQSGASGGADPA